MNQVPQDFILLHQDSDVRQLAFLGSKYPEVDMPSVALDQIRGRQMARTKLPRWASIDGIISARYGVRMLSKNSHLFVGSQPMADFPGRSFHILAVSSLNKKELKHQLGGITKANVKTIREPMKNYFFTFCCL